MPRKKKSGKYKLKTHKATAKRFKMTGTGKIVRTKGGKSHRRRMSAKRVRRQWDKTMQVGEKAMQRRIRRLAPYLGKYKANPPA
ncbi:MAG: 50S ribosomal protein L35 [Chloroflexi bacterium]|nr:50S ribosomal protein L35 [Chloroflexota bacterium]